VNDYNIVSLSFGKDSTATMLLAVEREVENLRAVFADTGHEHPLTYEYGYYLEQATGVKIERVRPDFSDRIAAKRELVQGKWRNEGVSEAIIEKALSVLHPTGNSFLDLCLWKGRFPSTRARFCTEELKVFPIQKQIFEPLLSDCDTGEVYSWQGVRADESAARAKLPELDEVGNGLWNYRPILNWTAAEVFEFHRKHGVKWNPLYEQGMSRVGCMPCINCNKSEMGQIAARFPDQIERVREWERLVAMASKRGASTFFGPGTAPDTPLGTSIDAAVEWSKTVRGGRQYDLIAAMHPEPEPCSSAYGLCDSYQEVA
jgi:3'-phosphoadenosine 5'-phosphosulfate sulfotransferase (PAPS reductase)/FAD synthetase